MDHSCESDPHIGRVLADQYRIDAVLGQGGMGRVYRGLQLSVTRPVAIKLITGPSAHHTELVKRFRREAEATARLSHPNTVRLFDFGDTDQRELFMVMELLQGEDLGSYLERHGPLPVERTLRIARQILQALSEAHALGIVHRDLKPANVFLSRVQGGDGFIKVMDFGIAGIERARGGEKLTATGAVVGTPAYMSPEQAQGQPVDGRTDLYSLGVLLFEMLTGRPPFEADTIVSLLLAHVGQPPPRLRDCNPALADATAVQALLDALLDKVPEQRPASANTALSAVDAVLAGRPLPFPTKPDVAAQQSGAVAAEPVPSTPLGWTRRPHVLRQGRLADALRYSAAAAVIAAALALVWLRLSPSEPEGQPPAESALRHVTIASVPKGASVLLDGAELGKTPLSFAFEHDTEVEIALAGYVPQRLRLGDDTGPYAVATLVPSTRALRAADSAQTPPSAALSDERAPAGPARSTPAPPLPASDQTAATHSSNPPRAQPSAASNASQPPTATRRSPLRAVGRALGDAFGDLFGHKARRARRQRLLQGPPPFESVADAQRAYDGKRIDADAYEDAVWVLKARRARRIDQEKAKLRSGAIDADEYETRVDAIDRAFRGR